MAAGTGKWISAVERRKRRNEICTRARTHPASRAPNLTNISFRGVELGEVAQNNPRAIQEVLRETNAVSRALAEQQKGERGGSSLLRICRNGRAPSPATSLRLRKWRGESRRGGTENEIKCSRPGESRTEAKAANADAGWIRAPALIWRSGGGLALSAESSQLAHLLLGPHSERGRANRGKEKEA